MNSKALFPILTVCLLANLQTASAQGTAFTYNARLADNGNSANGNYDLVFAVFDAPSGGTQVSAGLTKAPIPINNGLFAVTLDFGGGVFSGGGRWLEIGVRTNGSAGAYTPLSPRQQVSASPYAITAGAITGQINGNLIANGSITSAQLSSGSVGGSQLAPGAAAFNLGSSGQSGVASGGTILSASANASDLLNAGYIKLGAAELGELWQARSGVGPPAARYGHTAVWTGTELIIWGGTDGISFVPFGDGARYNPALNAWSPISTNNAPSPRYSHTAIWSGSEMILWGGYAGVLANSDYNDGGRYNPILDAWTSVPTNNAPVARQLHKTIWTGSEMIVWGGITKVGDQMTGGRYNPSSNTWTDVVTNGAPAARSGHRIVWSGSEMLVWGGFHFINSFNRTYFNDGGRYNPAANTWTPIPTNGAPTPRQNVAMVWTGSEMLLWGGSGRSGFAPDGGRFNPAGNTWATLTTNGAPSLLQFPTAVWTGSELVLWGGSANTGGRYNPAANTWASVTTNNAPAGRGGHTANWTGSEMIIWGGGASVGSSIFNDGGRYRPADDSWRPTPTTEPSARDFHTALWTGSEMIIWGGVSGGYLNDGARFNPVVNSWTPMSLLGAPAGRTYHGSVWTGTEAIIWGGQNGNSLNDGARYNPISDVWLPISVNGAPSARHAHSALWTGTEMIVWGGKNGDIHLNDGGRYNPASNTWNNVSATSAPEPRYSHTAVWTGAEMIIWAGVTNSGPPDYIEDVYNNGGRYNPLADAWTPVAVNSGRIGSTAVWTGSDMIVWGGYINDVFGTQYPTSHFRYNPGNDTWTQMTTNGSPIPRAYHSTVWTGSEMIVWGGFGFTGRFGSGGRYDPISDTWQPTTGFRSPGLRAQHTGVWTGTDMLVFGGWASSTPQGPYSLVGSLSSYTPARKVYLYSRP